MTGCHVCSLLLPGLVLHGLYIYPDPDRVFTGFAGAEYTDKIQKRPGYITIGVAPSNDPAGDVNVGVMSSADLAGDVTIGVASLADFAGDVAVGVASSADLAGVFTVGVADSADLGDVAVSVVSSDNFAGYHRRCDVLGRPLIVMSPVWSVTGP